MSTDLDERLAELRGHLLRHRADRYPFEHATLQFHLGAVLLDSDQPDAAAAALRVSAQLFDEHRRPVERAKAGNLLGAALLHLEEIETAAAAFSDAAAAFEAHDQPLELAAARFNLGLLHRRRGEHEPAAGCFADALERFAHAEVPGQASAAARELGAVRLELGESRTAAEILEQSLELAERNADRRQVGAAANLLGLARLATGETQAAAEALRLAASAYPRQLDAANHAMATANLALAHERLGDPARGRLAAWRAVHVPDADAPVVAQASAVLERLGQPTDDVLTVLEQTPSERWPSELLPYLTALLDVDAAERQRMLGHWIDGQLGGRLDGTQIGAGLLEALLELPPAQMETLVTSLLSALGSRDADAARFRTQLSRAMARFPLPQWQRLESVFERLALETGDVGPWS